MRFAPAIGLWLESDAGMNFEQLTRQVMDKRGFTCGLWTPCVYVHREQNMQAYVYGDIFVIKGARCDFYDFFEQLKAHVGKERRCTGARHWTR